MRNPSQTYGSLQPGNARKETSLQSNPLNPKTVGADLWWGHLLMYTVDCLLRSFEKLPLESYHKCRKWNEQTNQNQKLICVHKIYQWVQYTPYLVPRMLYEAF